MVRSPAIMAAKAYHALTAIGAIVQVDANVFMEILARVEHPLVVTHQRKWAFGSDYQYLTPYKGLYFYVELRIFSPFTRRSRDS